ncbi:retron St85 family RNA-directed DNA polymerase [Aliivibrio logei]|uniref:RNA-directed DNA polymerase n=1 Tax=Aliivibrio logei TaxID=688 RepID=A0A1B9NW71_ALILO|nr:retron St85 family RNA-directed DNA polymerase [Aliivibrio logei]OCH19470.1 reverse transcriptase [Aliivibrio logei]
MILLKYLAKELLLDESYIEELANSASNHYKSFTIPKKSGGDRLINQPSRELKALQRTLHDNILSKLPIHDSAFAYRDGQSIDKHAKVHLSARYLLRLDFKDFFESIKAHDIYRFINKHGINLLDNWSELDTKLLVDIVCYKQKLTMGSVTSPILSNAICFALDKQLEKICYMHDVKYSRYADDLFFSTSKPNVLRKIEKDVFNVVAALNEPEKLKINRKKTYHSSKKNRMSVTGIILTTDGNISIGRDNKRKVRTMVFSWNKLDVVEKRYLQGYLSFCASIEPEFINSLCNKYGADKITEIQRYN